MSLELLILTPDQQTRRVSLENESLTLGRAHSNDLSYPEDASLSRRHLRFRSDDRGWSVEDLGSKNGTLLNGTRVVSREYLSAGDRMAVGHLLITLVDPEAGVDAAGVVFVPGAGPEIHPQATVMTSLEGLLSGEATAPGAAPSVASRGAEPDSRGKAFNSPVVRALVRAGRELAGHRPLEELFPLILDLSISAVGAERGVVMMQESDKLVSRAVHGEGFRISTTVRDRVLKEKTSILVRDLAQDEAFRKQVSISEQQIHTMMAVPLQTESRVLGLIYVDSRSFVREFTSDDLNLLTVLANVAAIRVEQQRLAEVERQEQVRTRDLEQAAEIQRSILPGKAPTITGIDLAGHNEPCRTVGGDYYDFLSYGQTKVGLVLGDVAGKGMSAAMLMSALQARVQILAEDPGDLAHLMARLDQSLAANCPTNRFITLFFAVIDSDTGRMDYCNAGHNPPIVVRADGEVEMLAVSGTVLGMLPELGYGQQSFEFASGDILALFSDGVTEAENADGDEYGEERLAQLLAASRSRPAEAIVNDVFESVAKWTGDAAAADDITVLVARMVD